MLGLLYWLSAPKATANRTPDVVAENVERLVAASSEHYEAERYSDALASA